MKNVVLKFGGTSMATSSSIKLVAEIIKNTKNLKAVVVSAPGKSEKHKLKVTDALLFAYQNPKEYDNYINYVKSVFADILSGLDIYFDLSHEFEKINKHFKKFKTKSYLISRGEYLIAKIFAIYLNIPFIDSKNVIKFANNGKILQKTYKNIHKSIKTHGLVIIPGFYGSNWFNKIKVMCRGGSDITGSIVAKALKNAVYYNYTDVDGIFDSSPELDSNPIIIRKLNYDDVKFLSFYGASVLHYKCTSIFNQGRTIIKNTFNPKASGSVIFPKKKAVKTAITVTYGVQICFNEKDKKINKLLKKIKHEKLYFFSRLGEVFYALRLNSSDKQEKLLNKLYERAKSAFKIAVYGIIGDIDKVKSKIKKQHKECILSFMNENKSNFVYLDID